MTKFRSLSGPLKNIGIKASKYERQYRSNKARYDFHLQILDKPENP
jgi:hypothetical protein